MENQELESISPDFEIKFISFVGKIGLVISILLAPPVFTKLFAVSGFVLNEYSSLWFYCLILFSISLPQILFPSKFKISLSLIFFVIIFFIIIELFARTYVVLTYGDVEKQELGLFGNKTYEEFSQYKGHPFLAYTGNPGISYQENGKIMRTTVFNSMGFVGKEFDYIKPKNTIRVACIGGSTTERGYPAITEYQLNKIFKDSLKFEVLNFGVSGWTSANSLINYVLNVREFNPDYVLIHHGWNEERIRNTPENLFKSDYSHALTYFHEPEIIDKIPIRISLLYRILKNKFSYTPDWMFLGDATTIKERPKTPKTYDKINELNAFKRNIKTIIDLSIANNSKVILSTQPFSLSKTDETSKTIEQGNKIIRELSSIYDKQLIFLDLDNSITGNLNSVFIDLAHMNGEGTFYKGSEFARVIINNITNDSIKPTSPFEISAPISYHQYIESKTQNKDRKDILLKKARSKGLSLHTMLKRDLFNIFNERNKETKPNMAFNYSFQEYKIINNIEWYKQIKTQAKERNISVEENLEKNVKYMLRK